MIGRFEQDGSQWKSTHTSPVIELSEQSLAFIPHVHVGIAEAAGPALTLGCYGRVRVAACLSTCYFDFSTSSW